MGRVSFTVFSHVYEEQPFFFKLCFVLCLAAIHYAPGRHSERVEPGIGMPNRSIMIHMHAIAWS